MFNSYTGSTTPIINGLTAMCACAITGATNGLSKLNAHNVASWDFHQDYEYPTPNTYHLEVEWYDSFLTFLSRFDVDDTVLVTTIRMPYGPDLIGYIDIDFSNFDVFMDDFINWNGRVRVTWLNFN